MVVLDCALSLFVRAVRFVFVFVAVVVYVVVVGVDVACVCCCVFLLNVDGALVAVCGWL